MTNLEQMYRAVQFIEQHLKEPICVQDVADAVDFSLYHFSRTFNNVIGHSPYDYIIRRRLSQSARELMAPDRKIVDIALEYQFNNPETYARAFRRMFGLLPNQVRKNKSLTNLIFKSEVTLEYIEHINKGDYLKPITVEMEAIHLVGLAGLVKGDRSTVDRLWQLFRREAGAISNRLDPDQWYGVSFFPVTWDLPGYFHLVGAAVDSLEMIPPLLVGKTIGPHRYARFIHKGSSRQVELTYDYIYQTWLPRSGKTIAAPLEIEIYGRGYSSDDPDAESEILIPID